MRSDELTAVPLPETDIGRTLPRPFRVVARSVETADTVTIDLVAADSRGALTFRPGQFTMVYAYGVGEVPLSISGDPASPRLLRHTVRRVGAVTEALFGLTVDDEVGIRGPFGTSWPVGEVSGRDVLVVAGGIGLAPLRPAIHELLARRASFGSMALLYGARTPADLLYVDDLHDWRGRFDLEVEVTVDRPTREWRGDVGVVTTLLPRVPFSPAETTALVCGPEMMMRIVARDLVRLGVPDDRVHISVERNMKCGVGLCGHCQFGADFVCRTGPVMSYAKIADRLKVAEI